MTDNNAKFEQQPLDEQFSLEAQWQQLTDDWQSQPYEKVDINKLVTKLKRRTLGAKAVLILDVLATLFLFVALWFVMTTEPLDLPTAIYLGVGAVGSLVYTVFEFKIRMATWRLDASTPEQIFEKNISGLKGAITYAKLWLYSCFIMLPLVNWYVYEVTKDSEVPSLPGYIFVNGLIVVMIVIGRIYQNKRQQELDQLNSIKNC